MTYDFKSIESKWQKYWQDKDIYKVTEDSTKLKYYVLDMFPYPSGTGLHVGHVKGYSATDVFSRFKRMQGYNVLHPMGWDAFGLPAENFALANKIHPKIAVEQNIAMCKSQMNSMGFDFDWNREVNTTDPSFYHWTQWAVAKMFEKGLMEEVYEPIIWCPTCKTGLAMEDVEDGKCERCSTLVERKPLRQWIIKITKYADRLLEDLKLLDWEESVKEMQRHWIGRSEGVEFDLAIEGVSEKISVFTTRIDTVFGMTYVVLAPEHELVKKIVTENQKQEVENYLESIQSKSDLERTDMAKEKTGVFTGVYAVNPFNNEKVPVWIADYVLANYGTGAVMAVPAHDERDWDFAKKYSLSIIPVIQNQKEAKEDDQSMCEDGVLFDSGNFSGLSSEEARKKLGQHVEEKGFGKVKVNYKLRDWVFARQRYWGEPFPFIRKEDGSIQVVPDTELPVMLPEVEHYEPSGTGESPLSNITDWVNTPDGKRETNTMPQWAGSSWYYLRYLDPQNSKKLVDPEKDKYWMGKEGVDLYVGGLEHATRHLIYARFWHKFLYDIGVVSTVEPFHRLINVGLVMAEDGRKMSKRWKNVIDPMDVIAKYGADTIRMYELFMGPFVQSASWSTGGIEGIHRFLHRFSNLFDKRIEKKDYPSQEKLIHKTIKKVSKDLENFQFNTAISQLMICVNELMKEEVISESVLYRLTLLIGPFCPHLAEELYNTRFSSYFSINDKLQTTNESVIFAPWPNFDEALTIDDEITVVVQVNGKVRGEFQANRDVSQEEAFEKAIALENVQNYTKGGIVKKIYVPGKLVSIVVKQ